MISNTKIKEISGCTREVLPVEIVVEGALPGLILTSWLNEYLCEAEQSYLDEDAHPTGNPEDYVLVQIVQVVQG